MQTKIDNCLKEGELKGERHKGLKKVNINEELIKGHMNKSLHNFKAMLVFKKEGFSDWSASASFYTLYHALLAIHLKTKGFLCPKNYYFYDLQNMDLNQEIKVVLLLLLIN